MNTNFNHYSVLTENAEKVLKSRYYMKDEQGNVIEDFDGMCHRVANAIAQVEEKSIRNEWTEKFYNLIHSLDFLPNTPTLVNAGKKSGLSACYVIPIENNYKQILNTLKNVSLIFKSGGGTGFNFSWVKLNPFFKKPQKVCVYLNPDHPDYEEYQNTTFKNLFKYPIDIDILEYYKSISTENSITQIVPVADKNFINDDGKLLLADCMDQIFDLEQLLTNNITCIDFRRLRPKDSIVNSTKGVASGPVSFMKIWDATIEYLSNYITPITTIKLFDVCTECVKQGGVRRGANMGIVNMDSEYIYDFITCKENQNEIINFNLSVGIINDKLFKGEDYLLRDYTDIENKKTQALCDSKKLLDKITYGAWKNGEPGIIFLDKINQFNPIQEDLVAVNPCGEQPLLGYESCNLGSINLVNMVYFDPNIKKYYFSFYKFEDTIKCAVRFLDNVIDANVYPVQEIDHTTKKYRKIGLGVMGLADLFYLLEIPYNSSEAYEMSERISRSLTTTARDCSIQLGYEKGSFPAFDEVDLTKLPITIEDVLGVNKSVTVNKKEYALRNTTVTTIAPTGTLSVIASVSSGIEPNFGIVYIRNTLGATTQLYYVNKYFKEAFLQETGIIEDSEDYNTIMKKIMDNGSIIGIDEIPEKLQKIFVCTGDIDIDSHINQQSSWQKYVDNAISKTINCSNETTVEEIKDAYMKAYNSNCKGITVYRDGSRDSQVLITGKSGKKDTHEKGIEKNKFDSVISICSECNACDKSRIVIKDRPVTLQGITKKVNIGCGSLYVTVNYDDTGIIEVFTNTGKHGGCPSQSEATARMASLALRAGIPIDEVVKQLKGIRCMSTIKRPGLKVLSCPDAIARCLIEVNDMIKSNNVANKIEKKYSNVIIEGILDNKVQITNGVCPECGSKLEFEGGCCICRECGYSKCG